MSFNLFFFTLLLVQIFILAWTANDINTQSLLVGDAIYESLWINQSTPIKRMLQIMLMRAQKQLAITIGPFREMNIEASLITMKAAYSYASLMIQTYE